MKLVTMENKWDLLITKSSEWHKKVEEGDELYKEVPRGMITLWILQEICFWVIVAYYSWEKVLSNGEKKKREIWKSIKRKLWVRWKMMVRIIRGYVVIEVLLVHSIMITVTLVSAAFLFELCGEKKNPSRRVYGNLKRNVTVNSIMNLVMRAMCREMYYGYNISYMVVGVIIRVHTIDIAIKWIEKIEETEVDSMECTEKILMITVGVGSLLTCIRIQREKDNKRGKLFGVVFWGIIMVVCKEIREVTRWWRTIWRVMMVNIIWERDMYIIRVVLTNIVAMLTWGPKVCNLKKRNKCNKGEIERKIYDTQKEKNKLEKKKKSVSLLMWYTVVLLFKETWNKCQMNRVLRTLQAIAKGQIIIWVFKYTMDWIKEKRQEIGYINEEEVREEDKEGKETIEDKKIEDK